MSSNGQNIIDKILSDAKAEAAVIIEQAEAEAGKIIADAEQKSEKELISLERLSRDEADKAAAKEISAAEMAAKKMILVQKKECIENVINAAKAKLTSLSGAEYEQMILKMLGNFADSKACEVILSAKDKEVLKGALDAAGYKVSAETRDFDGGFVLKKGDIEYNYSFESIISVEKEEIEKIAAEILFA
ncbi:MAG: hypothetical protein IJC39_05530 [Firmicutes bacterium]|nr:hypothetical protein [Bacillota bacterium]